MTEVSAPLAFVTLPKPPSLNGLFRNTGKRHTVAHARQAPRAKSKAYLSWIAAATVELRAYRLDRVKGPYALSIQLGRRKGSDLDNYAKAISDLLVSMQIVQDDSLCELLVIGWADDLPANRCRIGVERARVATPAPKPKASARIVAEKKARAVMPKLNDFGAGKPVQFTDEELEALEEAGLVFVHDHPERAPILTEAGWIAVGASQHPKKGAAR
jgi:Holliday junction resolvase RusA-like endonuclease